MKNKARSLLFMIFLILCTATVHIPFGIHFWYKQRIKLDAEWESIMEKHKEVNKMMDSADSLIKEAQDLRDFYFEKEKQSHEKQLVHEAQRTRPCY